MRLPDWKQPAFEILLEALETLVACAFAESAGAAAVRNCVFVSSSRRVGSD